VKIALITLFPEMFEAVTHYGVTSRAVNNGLLEVHCINPRNFTSDRHQTVDDRPYGGGPGMLMKIEPLRKAIIAARQWHAQFDEAEVPKVIYMSPQGQVLKQRGVMALADTKNLIIIAGRYEGVDERLIECEVDEEWSIGDYVLSGGELPAMVLMDAVIRQLPGALGHANSAVEDSFTNGLLDCPHYTRPENYEGQQVPDVLLSGNHDKIRRWRLKCSLERTLSRRPELLEDLQLNNEQQVIMAEILSNTD